MVCGRFACVFGVFVVLVCLLYGILVVCRVVLVVCD